MKPLHSLIQHPKHQSAFYRYFVLILILVFTLLSLFSFYIYYISYKNFSAQQALSEQATLEQAINKIDDSLYFTNQIAAATSLNSDVVNVGIMSSLKNQERNFSIITTLKNVTTENAYLNKVYLYEHRGNCVFTSDSDITTLSGYKDSSVIHTYLSLNDSSILEKDTNRFCSRLMRDGQKLYLVYDFIYSSKGPLNTLLLDLNKEIFFREALSVPSLDNYHVMILDSDGSLIFSTLDNHTHVSTVEAQVIKTSSHTGWRYLLYAKQPQPFSISGFGKLFAPFFILFLGISLFLTYIISYRTYYPIQKLIQLVGQQSLFSSKNIQRPVNEFDYLETAYQSLITNQQITSDILKKACPELEQKLFSNLINGIEYSHQELEQQLSVLPSTFNLEGKYQTVLLQSQTSPEADSLTLHIYTKHIQQLAFQFFNPDWGALQILPTDDNHTILIIQYAAALSMAQVKRIFRGYKISLERETASSGLELSVAAGKVYYSLADIPVSYRDAREEMRYQLYYQEDTDVPGDISDDLLTPLLHRLDLSLGKGDILLAKNMLSKLLHELFTDAQQLSQIKKGCEQLLDILVEKSLSYHVDQETTTLYDYPALYQHMRTASSKTELKEFIQMETSAILQAIESESQKKQFRLISRAKEYIANHYNNCNLSINEIAQDVGCSPSYLSNIFTEYTKENLVAYLNSYRIHIAQDLLKNSKILIKDIGFKTGFNTIQNFNRVFKKTTGMTPNEYRKAHQQL